MPSFPLVMVFAAGGAFVIAIVAYMLRRRGATGPKK